ncbi:MAG: leucine-rich repeat domain-containing protein [Candidatus Thorarchaeota archaeon]|jgi:hypothetical protein
MNEVVIEYLRFSRKKERVRYGSDTTEISLAGMSIQEISFIEIGPLNDLRVLDLSDNKLETIELDFLRESKALQEIDIKDNEILSLNTKPLESLKELRELQVSGNLMKDLDLSGLSGCKELKILNISNNHIHGIDLDPLCSCSGLVELNVQGNQLEAIDLTPLESSSELQILNLSHNWIREIDLGPLSGKNSIQSINMSENPVSQIDLSPLEECTSLETLILDWTQIASLDLGPLSSCVNLRRLGIAHNKITELNLWPLAETLNLQSLDISGNMNLEFTFWPLFSLPHLEELRISSSPEPLILHPPDSVVWPNGLEQYRKSIESQNFNYQISEFGINVFRDRIAEMVFQLGPLGRFFVRVAVLDSFDLANFIGYDCDITHLLENISNSNSIEVTRSELKSIVSKGLIEQVQSGGSTHLIDVDLAYGVPELAVIAPTVLELRKRELEKVILSHCDGTIDLKPLWFTSYGFEILSALCMGLSTNLQGIEQIRVELLDAGIELNIQEDSGQQDHLPNISEELQAYIIMYALQCGKMI